MSQLEKGIVSEDKIASVKESVRRLRLKGFSHLNEDEAMRLKDDIYFLAMLDTSSSEFREHGLKFSEEVPSLIRCLRQRKERSIEQPNLIEDLKKQIAETEDTMQALDEENKQLDEEIMLTTVKKAEAVEEKEVLASRMRGIYYQSLESSTILCYVDGGGDELELF